MKKKEMREEIKRLRGLLRVAANTTEQVLETRNEHTVRILLDKLTAAILHTDLIFKKLVRALEK